MKMGFLKFRKMREVLKNEFPESSDFFTDSYIQSVIQVPNRTFHQAHQKLISSLKWRREFEVERLSPSFVQKQLDTHSMYWYGYDSANRPILWVRPKLKGPNLYVEKEIQLHVLLVEEGIRTLMPPNVDTFTLIAETNGLGFSDFDLSLMRSLINILTNVYPDRLECLYVGPAHFVLCFIYKILTAIMPRRLVEKIHLMSKPSRELLERIKFEEIPDFFQGPSNHIQFIDENLAFNWDEMISQQRMKRELITSTSS